MGRVFALVLILMLTATLSVARGLDSAPSVEPLVGPVVPITAEEAQLTITLAGDTGLNGSFQLVYAGFGSKQGARVSWREASEAIAAEITGDVIFANLETVVTDRNDLEANLKRFVFRTHPDGVRHLVSLGFNVFSTANNHAMDFGLTGARETLKHLAVIGAERELLAVGLGLTRAEASSARIITRKGMRVAFGALGIIGSAYTSPTNGEERPGQLSYFSDSDFAESVARLTEAKADYRILSAHYGRELEPNTDRFDRRRFRNALAQGVDLVAGHHQHVVAGVETVDGKVIFYGLGNFMHLGTTDMSRFDICRDYGLLTRVHLAGRAGERPKVRAIEAVPLTAMHRRTTRMGKEQASARIQVLNHLAKQFDGDGASRGVRFATLDDGSGLYCAPGAEKLKGRVGTLCAAGPKITEPEPKLAAQIEDACSRQVVRTVENETEFDSEFGLMPESPADIMPGLPQLP